MTSADLQNLDDRALHSVRLEICAGNIESVLAAAQAGADRIELCTDLASGGTTPSYGLIATAVKLLKEYGDRTALMVLIRPRAGSFIYSPLELQIMHADIRACRFLGVSGVVFGCLKVDPSGNRTVNSDAVSDLLKIVEEEHWANDKPGSVTFHRAFDDCHDLNQAFEDICKFQGRLQRILTSGGCASAMEGLPMLEGLCKTAEALPQPTPRIMPGAGITAGNVMTIVQRTGALDVHASAKGEVSDDKSVGDLFKVNGFASTKVRSVEAILRQLSSMHQQS